MFISSTIAVLFFVSYILVVVATATGYLKFLFKDNSVYQNRAKAVDEVDIKGCATKLLTQLTNDGLILKDENGREIDPNEFKAIVDKQPVPSVNGTENLHETENSGPSGSSEVVRSLHKMAGPLITALFTIFFFLTTFGRLNIFRKGIITLLFVILVYTGLATGHRKDKPWVIVLHRALGTIAFALFTTLLMLRLMM